MADGIDLRNRLKHPMQPVDYDGKGGIGVVRFKPNRIVEWMLEAGKTGEKFDLNTLCDHGFSDEDWCQFAQLIGYSVSGWGSLSYVSDEAYKQAEASMPQEAK